MNKVILMGRLTKDPEIRYSQGAEPLAIARYTLAVNRRSKREGEPDADFVNCVAFGKGAEFLERYFKKGMQLLISGRISVRSWDDNTGQRRWSTEVITEEHNFTESRASSESRTEPRPAQPDYGQQTRSGYNSQPSYGNDMPPGGFSAISESLDSDDIPF